MAFFNEFPHTRTYDSDLAWLIERMKEVLAKMDRVDEILATIEALLASLPETIRAEVARQLLEYINSAEFIAEIAALVGENLDGVLKFPTSETDRIRLEKTTDYTISEYSIGSIEETNDGFSVSVLDLGGYWGFAISPKEGTGTGVLSLRITPTSGTGFIFSPRITLTAAGQNKFNNYKVNGAFILTEPTNRFLISVMGRGASISVNNSVVSSFVPEHAIRGTSATGGTIMQMPIILGVGPKSFS